MNKVIRFFPDSDLRCGHDGLKKMAMRIAGKDPTLLKKGEFIFFANTRLNSLKIFCPGNIICYLKSPDGRRLEMKTIQNLPNYFNGTSFNYTSALKQSLLSSGLKEAA